MGDWPSSHFPESWSAFTRSNRFITERFPWAEPLALRLECLDIIKSVWLVGGASYGAYLEFATRNLSFYAIFVNL